MRKIPLSVHTFFTIAALILGLLLAGGGLYHALLAAPADAVVGDGAPGSCDSNALAAGIANGGVVTFNCGANPHTIIADTYVINGSVEIDGGDLITLDGEGLRQLFLVQAGGSLTLRNIILQKGFASSGPGGAIQSFGTVLIQNSTLRENGTDTVLAGGALGNDTNGTMTIEESTIEANSAADGAAIYTRGHSLTILNSAIRDNYTRDNGGFFGGGAILQEVNTDGIVNIIDSRLEGNKSNPNGSLGGAISILTGQLSIDRSIIAHNEGYGGGGAIYLAQGVTAAIHASILADNQTLPADGSTNYTGGAILNHGSLLIDRSTIHNNRATDGGGIFSGGENSSLTVSRSLVVENVATGGGGGLLLFPGVNVIEDSTIVGNNAAIGGGIRSGITENEGTATLLHVTLARNSATTNGDNLYVDDQSQPVSVRNSILAYGITSANCYAGAPLNSGGYNVSDDESCGLSSTGDQQNSDPQLGALAENDGPTSSLLPAAGSPVLDIIPDGCSAADQRGVVRPQGAGCDSGAVEVVVAAPTATPVPGALQLTVDVAAQRKPISDNIYGLHYTVDENFAREIDLPLRRWGGNITTRYNWQINATNHASDWFFHNNSNYDAITGNEITADQWVARNNATGAASLITLPMAGYVAKDREQNTCGYAVSKYGAQDDVDNESGFPNCGNGLQNGVPIANDPLDTSVAIDEAFVAAWVQHLLNGAAANGRVDFYALDNEPDLWFETHRDIAPVGWKYDEFRDLSQRYAAAVKATDPNAQILGPVVNGWTYYWHGAYDGQREDWETPDDRNAHGGTPFVQWYLQQMAAYEQANGVRLLDYLDLHYYPQSGVALRDAGDANLQALRLRSTRSLWDPTYVDESWIKDAGPDGGIMRLIPRMREWVDQNYPGTKLAITEYNFGGLEHINGALTQADVLGIFGREGLDMATLFDTPYGTGLFTPSSPGAYAFRVYRNYDGAGGRFGDVSVQAASSDQAKLSIYAAQRTGDGALTLVIINKSGAAQTATLSIANLAGAQTAQVYRYSAANLAAIAHLPDQSLSGNGFTASYPTDSITVLVVNPGAGNVTPTPTLTPTPSGTPVPVVQNFIIPSIARPIPLQYPLNVVEVFNPNLNRFVLTRTIDFEICLYRKDLANALAAGRIPYEKAVQFMADAIYEMTNGAHLIGEVTIFYNCTDLATEVVWSERLWPNATLNGYGNDLGTHVAMADTFTFPTPYAALQAGNERGTGYTLAHEWGHYFYGMDDQYANKAVDAKGTPTAPCVASDTYQGPCFSDQPVNPSVMTSQWNATGGDYTWLNFSIAKNETKRNRHWRVYQADNWTTLTRSADSDPQAIYTSKTFYRRNYFPELGIFAPQGTATPRIDLPASVSDLATGPARSQLKITWRDRNGKDDIVPQYKPNLDPYHVCLSCPARLNWENKFIYPEPAIFNVQLQRQLPIANMNVVARLTSPSGSTTNVPLTDVDGAGNYQAALPYSSGGEYQVSFVFTNPNNAAVETNAGLDYTPSLSGESAPLIVQPVNQDFTITASTIFTVADFAADDHANDIAGATVLTTTNAATAGRIDSAGDVDFFTFSADRTGDFAVRITDLALDVQPQISVQRGNGTVVFQGAWNPTQSTYLFARLAATAGERFTIRVADARPNAQGGHYRISVGAPIAGEGSGQGVVYLPLIWK
ncbi:MAG: glycoside hydrolase family 44 protein [Caldilineaceae bacterium]